MKIEINYQFSDNEIKETIRKIDNDEDITTTDLLALLYGSKKYIEIREECKADPSYQWGYGHTLY